MFKVHLLATDRGEGKTRWLRNSISKLAQELEIAVSPESRNLLVLVPTMKYAEHEFKEYLRPRGTAYLKNFDGMDYVFRGMSYNTVFIDEYQKLTPQNWYNLKMHLVCSRVQELYLAGDSYFTFDQLSRDPNDTEHLYRRLTAITDELNTITKR